MNLREQTQNILDVLEGAIKTDDGVLDTNTGEVFDEEEFQRFVDKLYGDREEKFEAVGLTIIEMGYDLEAAKKEEERIRGIRNRIENKIEWLKGYVLKNLFEGEKIKTAKVSIGTRKSQAVVIKDMDALPEEYIRAKVEVKADKTAIKNDLKAGKTIAGAELVENISLSVR